MPVETVTVEKILDSVAFRLTNSHTVDTTFQGEILDAIGRTLQAVVLASNMPAFRTEATLSLVNGTAEYDLPSDFEAIIADSVYNTTQNNHQIKYYEETMRVEADWVEQLTTESEPIRFTIINRESAAGATEGQWQIRFIPTPDTSYTVKYTYFAAPTHIDSSTTVTDDLDYRFPRAFVQLLVLGTCLEFPEYLGTDAEALYTRRVDRLMRGIKKNQKPVVGYNSQNRKYLVRGGEFNDAWQDTVYNSNPLR